MKPIDLTPENTTKIVARKSRIVEKLIGWSRLLARFILVAVFLLYGIAKFAGAQFISSGGILDTPVADLRGIELTWIYFGYSWLNTCFVAGGEVLAALLLLFDRTARLGTAVLFPITLNIVVVNFGYQIGLDTQIVSSILLGLNLYLLAWDLPTWKRVFWDETSADLDRKGHIKYNKSSIIRGSLFLIAAAGLYGFLAKESSHLLGPLSGEWRVESATLDGQKIKDSNLGGGWKWLCFDPFGRLSVRTDRFTFRGKYQIDPSGSVLKFQYDPEPLPPFYPGQLSDQLSFDQELRLLGAQTPDFKWPVELTGNYRKEGDQLIVTIKRGEKTMEWKFSPYTRPKF